MMKKTVLLPVLLFFSLIAMAANGIHGRIVDANSQAPLDFVNVALFKDGKTAPAAGVTSNDKGQFNIPSVADGKYNLRVSYVGYNTVNQIVVVTGKTVNVGIIKLEENSKRLAEVEVVGQAAQMRFDVDKKVFNVDQNIAAAGGSATDVLKNIPSVKVDNEGNVSLRKDANVEVWINGKPSGMTADNRAQILQQMPAESIESIEVMTNPSAKFNPEGTAGIINLVMKKNRKAGHFGSVSAGLMYPTGGKLGGTLGGNINYSSSKIDAYLNVGYRGMTMQGGGYKDLYNYFPTDTTYLHQTNTSRTSFGGVMIRAGIDYHIDSKNTISLGGFGMGGTGNGSNTYNNMKVNQAPYAVLDSYNRSNTGDGSRPSLNANLDFRHDFDKKGTHNLMASISYSSHKRSMNTQYQQTDLLTSALTSNMLQNSESKNKEFQVKVDYTNKPTESSRLEAGVQSTVGNRNSTSSAFDNMTNSNMQDYFNKFDYNEQIHAAYLTYGNRFGGLSIQAGLRGEYWWRKSSNTIWNNTQNIDPKTDFQIFPSMYLAYSLPKNNELQLNYTRRVNRPRGRQINPFRDLSDPVSISYGNPDLAPEYASSFELNYIKTWENHSLSASAYYRYTNNIVQSVSFKNNQIMENTYMNVSNRRNSGLEFVAKDRVLKVVNLTTSVNVYQVKLDDATYVNPYDPTIQIATQGNSSFSWSANMMANFMLSRTISGQITGEYSAPTVVAQGKESAEYKVDLGLRKTFWDRKLTLSLIANDIFNFNRERRTTSGAGFYQKTESYFHGRMLGVTLSYNFGNMKPKQDAKKKAGGMNDMNMDGCMD